MKKFAITGIGTDVGKTIVSAIFAEALSAHYWKPIQAGDLDFSDSHKIQSLTDNVTVLPERYRLKTAMSPHAAAALEGVHIQIDQLALPEVEGNLIVEGAGGLLVPLDEQGTCYTDVFERWNIPVIVVSRHYLGSINHTLLTAEVMRARGIEIAGLVFVGDKHPTTEEIILRKTKLPVLAHIPECARIDKSFILEMSRTLNWES